MNDTRDVNERTTYCILHQLFPMKTMRLMSASDDNLSIFFCDIPPMHLTAASLDRMCSRVGTG